MNLKLKVGQESLRSRKDTFENGSMAGSKLKAAAREDGRCREGAAC